MLVKFYDKRDCKVICKECVRISVSNSGFHLYLTADSEPEFYSWHSFDIWEVFAV